jgi:8-oxo-dGTP pyrophosphatase MutT (NUDIX family)
MTRFTLVPEAHLLLIRDDRILLLRRRNTDYEDGKYSVIAGHMEDGETARESICREALEEAGIELAPDDLEFAHVVHRADRGQRVGFFFRALRWQREPRNLEPHKADDLRWFALDALPNDMVPYVRRAIEVWRAGQGYSESGWAVRPERR